MSSKDKRRILAIVFADIVGYSAMMGADEEAALARVDRVNALVRKHAESRGGEVVKYLGDATLSAFESAAEAVRAAIAVQTELAASDIGVVLRIGIHVGDVILRPDDVFGDGVNIAARLEPLSAPGGILVSQTVADLVRALSDVQLESRGTRSLKNIAEPVAVWAVRTGVERPGPRPRRPWWWIPVAICLGLAAFGAVRYATRPEVPVPPAAQPALPPRDVQLTRYDDEQGLAGFALSPDGRTLVWGDLQGLWRRPVGGGPRESVVQGVVSHVDFLPDGDHLFVGGYSADERRQWAVIGLDGSEERGFEPACSHAALSPDGRLACQVQDAIRLFDGDLDVSIGARSEGSALAPLIWSPRGDRLASLHYSHDPGIPHWIEIHDPEARSSRRLEGRSIHGALAWVEPDRLLFVQGESETNLMALDDASLATDLDEAKVLFRWGSGLIKHLRADRTGRRIAYRKTQVTTNAWRAAPGAELELVGEDGASDFPSSWSRRGLLVSTTRNGSLDLVLLPDSGPPEPLVVDARRVYLARAVGDRVVYLARDAEGLSYERIGLDGSDRTELVRLSGEEVGEHSLGCGAERCLTSRVQSGELALAWLDVETGALEPLDLTLRSESRWALSPDATQLVVVAMEREGVVTRVDLATGERHDQTSPLELNQWAAWDPGGDSFVVAGMYSPDATYAAIRFHADGRTETVLEHDTRWVSAVVPAPDGVVYVGLRSFVPNLWMLDFTDGGD